MMHVTASNRQSPTRVRAGRAGHAAGTARWRSVPRAGRRRQPPRHRPPPPAPAVRQPSRTPASSAGRCPTDGARPARPAPARRPAEPPDWGRGPARPPGRAARSRPRTRRRAAAPSRSARAGRGTAGRRCWPARSCHWRGTAGNRRRRSVPPWPSSGPSSPPSVDILHDSGLASQFSHLERRSSVDLSGKVAIVTGSGRGLGLAYAQELARAGASVVLNDVDAQVAQEAVTSITDAGGSAVAEVVPVGTSEAAQALVDRAVEEFGRLDVLVNNAGILRDTTLWKMTDDDFDAVITTHLRGTFTCTRAAAIRMREQGEGGRIICVGSPTGQVGNFGQTNYAAAKAGIVGMVRTWALELARAQITVNAIVPVAITAMTETAPFLKPYIAALTAGEPLPSYARKQLGFGTPEDAAGLVAFLASDAAAGISGQAVGIGGDRLALWSHPSEVVVEFADGTGWSADAIADVWPARYAGSQQTVGQQFEPPAEGEAVQ